MKFIVLFSILFTSFSVWAQRGPIPEGFPNASNTGLAGVGLTKSDLTVYSGANPITGTHTYEKMSFPNGIIMSASAKLTLKKCFIGGVKYGVDMKGNNTLLLEDCTMVGGDNQVRLGAGIRGGGVNTKLYRCDISHYNDGLKLYSNITVKDSYIHGLNKNSVSHNDGMQSTTAVSNVTISHNTVFGSYRATQSAIRIVSVEGRLTNILVEKNYLSGGQWPLEATAKVNEGGICPASDFVIQYNVVEKDSWPQDNPHTAFNICGTPTVTCNYYHDGTPILDVGNCTFKDAILAATGLTIKGLQTLTIQAEAMTLSTGYMIDNGPKVMGYAIIVDANLPVPSTGTAISNFTGGTGTYQILISAIPENDGEPTIKLSVAGKEVVTETLPLDPKNVNYIDRYDVTVYGVNIKEGDEIKLEGTSHRGTGFAGARVDYITFIPNTITSIRGSMRAPEVSSLSGLSIHPYPITKSSQVNFKIEKTGLAELKLMTLNGTEVQTITVGNYLPGMHTTVLNTKDMAGGLYILRLQSENITEQRKVMIIK